MWVQVKRTELYQNYLNPPILESIYYLRLGKLVELKPLGERPTIGLKWFGLEEELSRVLERKVGLVGKDGLSPYIRPYVEKEMVVLYEEG